MFLLVCSLAGYEFVVVTIAASVCVRMIITLLKCI